MTFMEIQTALKAAGFDPGPIDGVPGPRTERAVRAYQEAHPPLKVDGVPGVATQASLLRHVDHIPPPAFALAYDFLVRAYPRCRRDIAAAFDVIHGEVALAGVDTHRRAAHFLSQVAIETGGLTLLEENLRYNAGRLLVIFPTHIRDRADAIRLAANGPRAIANRVYDGRLGNTHVDDGWTYRGSGFLQTTGRDNFRRIGHEADPDVVRTPIPGLRAALNYWQTHGCAHIADANDALALRRVINGGTNGMADVLKELARLNALLAL